LSAFWSAWQRGMVKGVDAFGGRGGEHICQVFAQELMDVIATGYVVNQKPIWMTCRRSPGQGSPMTFRQWVLSGSALYGLGPATAVACACAVIPSGVVVRGTLRSIQIARKVAATAKPTRPSCSTASGNTVRSAMGIELAV
jgi:hypothetical protein